MIEKRQAHRFHPELLQNHLPELSLCLAYSFLFKSSFHSLHIIAFFLKIILGSISLTSNENHCEFSSVESWVHFSTLG